MVYYSNGVVLAVYGVFALASVDDGGGDGGVEVWCPG